MRGLRWVLVCLAGAAVVACDPSVGAQPGASPTVSSTQTATAAGSSGAASSDAASSGPSTPGPIVLDATVAGSDQPPPPGSNEETIAQVATEFAVSRDAARRCSRLANARLVEELGAIGGDAACTRNLTEAQRAGSPTGLRIRSITVDRTGTRAIATVTEIGGPRDGAGGQWDFAKLSGRGLEVVEDAAGSWAVIDWAPDYLRSWDNYSLGPSYVPAGPGDPLAEPALRDCTNHVLRAMDDGDFHARFYQQFNYADNKRYAVILGCLEQAAPSDGPRLRTSYEFELIEGLTHGGWSAGEAHCAVEQVLGAMTDTQVAKSAVDVAGGPEFAGILVVAAHRCAGVRAPSSA
jgi:hypothetical protein